MQISRSILNKIEKEVFLNEEDPEDDECLVGSVRQAGSDGSRNQCHLILKVRIVRGRPHDKYRSGVMVAQQSPKLLGQSSSLWAGAIFLIKDVFMEHFEFTNNCEECRA